MQDTRALPSTGFRRRCAAWRVTFLCVAKEKSPKERPPPLVRPPASGSLGSGKRSGGTTQTVHPCTACVCAVVHDGAPDLVPSPRRTTGGNTPNAPPRGRLTGVGCNKRSALHRGNSPAYSGQRSGGLLSHSHPLAHPIARADCRTYATGSIDMVAYMKKSL